MSNIPLHERAKWLGASESAALFGLSPFVTLFELWHMKAGNIPAHNLDDDERVQAGQFMEPSIAAWAAHKWHWPIRNVDEYLTHNTVENMGASLDFEALDGGEPVEIKNVDNYIFKDPQNGWVAQGDNLLDVPVHYLIQVQHQLACKPTVSCGWLVVCVGGNRLYRMQIPRHPKFIAKIERRVAEFWQSIREKREPQPDFLADAEAISQLYGGRGDEFIDMRDNPRMRKLCEEYQAAHELVKEAEKRKKAALAEMKFRLQDARGALVDDNFMIKASFCEESTTVRRAHWRFNVIRKKEKFSL